MSLPIVGYFFRPPAKALCAALRPGAALIAVREPQNEFDPNAIRVIVTSAEVLAQSDSATLTTLCAEYGFSLDDIRDAESWHLGYIPAAIAATIAPRIEIGVDYPGQFALSPAGKPMIDIEFPREAEPSA